MEPIIIYLIPVAEVVTDIILPSALLIRRTCYSCRETTFKGKWKKKKSWNRLCEKNMNRQRKVLKEGTWESNFLFRWEREIHAKCIRGLSGQYQKIYITLKNSIIQSKKSFLLNIYTYTYMISN